MNSKSPYRLLMKLTNLLASFWRVLVDPYNKRGYDTSLFPPLMRSVLIRIYIVYVAIRLLPKRLYSELIYVAYLRQKGTKRDLDSIMRGLDRWVLKRSTAGYVAEDFLPPDFLPPSGLLDHGIQQVRREISEFVRVLLAEGLNGTILEIGLGEHGGTHILWREVFKRVITIEANIILVQNFKHKERLDSRSTIIVGMSQGPSTLKWVRTHVKSVDVLFIDGDHAYDSVASDWAMYHSLVRPGGVIAFHDSACRVADFGGAKFLEDLSGGVIDGKRHVLHDIVYSQHVGITYEKC